MRRNCLLCVQECFACVCVFLFYFFAVAAGGAAALGLAAAAVAAEEEAAVAAVPAGPTLLEITGENIRENLLRAIIICTPFFSRRRACNAFNR